MIYYILPIFFMYYLIVEDNIKINISHIQINTFNILCTRLKARKIIRKLTVNNLSIYAKI